MGRNQNNGNNIRATQYRASRYGQMGRKFQDTVLISASTSDATGDINITCKNLLPSLTLRQIIFDHIEVTAMPTLYNAGTSAGADVITFQCGIDDNSRDGREYPAGPWKIMSNINPVSFPIPVKKFAKTCPTLLTVYTVNEGNNVLKIRFKPFELTEPRTIQFRVTTTVRVLPQLEPSELFPNRNSLPTTHKVRLTEEVSRDHEPQRGNTDEVKS